MKKAKERRISKGYLDMSAYYLRKFSAAYDAVVKLGKTENPVSEPNARKKGRPKKGKVRALIERLEKYKGEVCRFITDFNVPFDNNLAKRDIRNIKVKTKVSGCFRTEDGAKDYLTILSFLGTAVKQGLNPYRVIFEALRGNSSVLNFTMP